MNPMFLTTLPLVGIDLGTIAFTLTNTLIILLLYRFLLHKKVVEMLDKRKDMISREVEAAKVSRENAEKVESEYTLKLAKSKEEAQEIVSAATSRASAKEQEIISEANKNAVMIRERAEESIELEKKRAVNEIKDQISELVIMTASAVAQKEINEADNKAIIESFLVKV
ncbi:MAG: F0F1 ATP synthase subunit B [Oscillospiraceae bacterium]|nr:F0F1 ATP synthase subunit B [Oscillospiraceae bacterium]